MVRVEKMKIRYKNVLLLFFASIFSVIFYHFNATFAQATENELQMLINETAEHGTLSLEEKVYAGNIVITKPIKIVGAKKTIIKGDGTGNVISIKAPNVHIKNVTVLNSGMSRNTSEEYAAIKIYTNDNVIENVTIRKSFHGIYLSQAHHNVIKQSHVYGENNGIIAGQGNGLHVYYSNENRLEQNKIVGTRDGIFFDYSNKNFVVNNDISKTRYGLHYMYSDHNQFYDNTFTFNTGGAAIMYSNFTKLKHNQFAFNSGTQSFGLLLQSANNSVIKDNQFYQNQRGIYIDQSSNNHIENNEIFLNQIGIELWASSSNQTFTKNQFSKNIASVLQLGGDTSNKWSQNGVGNNWAEEAVLLDLNQDQIGDYPFQNESALYRLVEENELAYLFLKSPTIKIYEKFHDLMNHQKVMFIDEYPLIQQKHSNNWMYLLLMFIPIVPLIKRRFWK